MTQEAQREEEIPVSVLVVDDHPNIREELRSMLAGQGVRVVEAPSGREALLRLLEEEFALVFIAVVMTEMSGLELASMIRERPRTKLLPIVFMTGLATELSQALKGYALGAVDYLLHPLRPEIVRAKVAVFAELYRSRKKLEKQSARLLGMQRREAEVSLLELRLASERRFRGLADAVPHIVFTTRPDGTLDYLNQRWFELTGISRAQMQEGFSLALHPDDLSRFKNLFEQAVRHRESLETDCRLRRGSDGTYLWHLCRMAPDLGAFGEVVAWIGSFTNVDEARRDHDTLLEFHATLDAVHDAVVIFEPRSMRLFYANEGASLLWGMPADRLLDRKIDTLVAEADVDALHEVLSQLKPGDPSARPIEVRCTRPDGSTSPAELLIQVISRNEETEPRAIVIARDTTERQRAEAERELLYRNALEAVRARDEFLSIASHELKTPLTALSLQLHALARPRRAAETGEPQVPEPVMEKLKFAHRQVERLTRLLNELLDVSRIHAGKLGLEVEDVDLAALVREVAARFADTAAKVGSELIISANEVCMGRWDRLRIEQVIVNLISNALKFGGGKPIELRIEPYETLARLVVRDHGIGIEPGEVERIFSRFERAVSSKSYAGLGLGLYIVRQIVGAHGGQIHVESRPGEGATFIVELPTVCTEPVKGSPVFEEEEESRAHSEAEAQLEQPAAESP